MKGPILTGALAATALSLAACTIQPLTPTPAATATLPAFAIVVATFTATLTPRSTETPVLAATATATTEPSATAVPVLAQPAAPDVIVPAPTAAPEVVQAPPPTVAAPATAAPTPEPPPAAPTAGLDGEAAAAEQYTIDLINAQRAAAGVAPLARDETLMGIARARVADMVARGYTGHNDPVTGAPLAREWMRAAGYTSPYLGENWYGSIKSPPAIVDVAMGWFMTDPPHARNILSPNYVAVGVGIGYNGRQWLLIQNFAGPNQ